MEGKGRCRGCGFYIVPKAVCTWRGTASAGVRRRRNSSKWQAFSSHFVSQWKTAPRGHLKRALWEDDFHLSANSPALLLGIGSSCSPPTPTPLPQKEKKCKFSKPRLRHGKWYRDGEAILQGHDYKHTAFAILQKGSSGKRGARESRVPPKHSRVRTTSWPSHLEELVVIATRDTAAASMLDAPAAIPSVDPGPVGGSSESTCSKRHVTAQELIAITDDVSRLWVWSNKEIIERSVSFQSRRQPMTDSWISVLRFQAKWVLLWPLALALSQRLKVEIQAQSALRKPGLCGHCKPVMPSRQP